jgi:hypothetical protein
MIVRFVNIGGIIDHHCLSFLIIISSVFMEHLIVQPTVIPQRRLIFQISFIIHVTQTSISGDDMNDSGQFYSIKLIIYL